MSERQHALLSASGASRWLTCTPSARFEEQFEEQESTYADEGTLAHSIAEYLIKQKLYGIDMSAKINPLLENPLFTDDPSMMDYVDEYAEFVAKEVREAPDGAILIQELRLNYQEFTPGGFGHLDVGIAAPGFAHIIDYKHGKGVPVNAFENKQLMVYGVGFLLDYDMVFDIEQISMTVYQPRINNISTYTISRDELMQWAREVLAPTSKIAFAGEGEFVPGDHCRFCRGKHACSAIAKLNMQLAKKAFEITELTDEQIIRIYNKADAFKTWISGIESHVLKTAIAGKKWPGMKLVSGRSTRKYTDEKAIIDALEEKGYTDVTKNKLIGITELTKKIGKKNFDEIVGPYTHKPTGTPTLVSEDDKRDEWNKIESAKLAFDDEAT